MIRDRSGGWAVALVLALLLGVVSYYSRRIPGFRAYRRATHSRPRTYKPPPDVRLGEQFNGQVVGVSDGDTISVMRDGREQRVRLAEIDCPELHQAFGRRAKQFTSQQAFGRSVTVRVRDRDRYGRVVGEVILPDGRSLDRELVRNGLAWWYRAYSRDASIGRLEDQARAEHAGLWADAHPQPPWEWRKEHARGGRASAATR